MSASDGMPRGVIHDLGYRPYTGPRNGEAAIARSLFDTGLRNAFGIGRSGKSKVLPFVLLALNLLPAVILVGIMVFTGLTDQPNYAGYASTTQILVSIFAAAQAPVLFSRDLRHGTIVLYLARPLQSRTYALIRWCSLVAAIAIFLVAPVVLLYLGAVLGGADLTDQSTEAAKAIVVAALLATMLASITGLISAWSTRRGFAIVASIAVLLFGAGVVATIQAIADQQGKPVVGEAAGLLSPYTLYRGITQSLFGVDLGALTPPVSGPMQAAYVAAALAVVVGGIGLLTLRFRKAGSR